MTRAVVDSRRCVLTIPKVVRERLNIRPGQEFMVYELNGTIIAKPVGNPKPLLKRARVAKMTAEDGVVIHRPSTNGIKDSIEACETIGDVLVYFRLPLSFDINGKYPDEWDNRKRMLFQHALSLVRRRSNKGVVGF